uniref:Uncharacterized protein n=1 Tax=Panagrolaimus sp. ES5 TaxID=591445 RepID=A0AC34FYQ4_9BILA
MLRFNFVLGFLFSTLLFFGGFSNGASNLPKVHQNVSGIEFDVELNEDIIYYSEPGFAQTKISYCRFLDPATNECEAGQISKWADLTTVFGRDAPYVPEFVTKIDMALLNPLKPNDFKVDVLTFGFPTYSMYLNNYPWFKASVFVGDANPDTESTGFSVYLEDSLKYCYNVRPQILVNEEHLNLNLFYNQKELKYLYYFFKKDQYICSLTFKYQEWFKGKAIPQQKYIFPIAHAIIDNFPTVNYAPDFFCIDALYGTFVSLYWNQQSNSLHFDENVLVDIFSKKFDKQFPPTFNSYGRQVFVYFRRPSEDRIFNGLWKNETEYDVHFEPITGTTLRKIWRAKKEYIQIDEPVGKYGGKYLFKLFLIYTL